MEDIENRLKDATAACLKTYGEWKDNRKDSKLREALMESVHELRKVAARLEIEMAISERDEVASKPIPIPAHRSNRKKQQGDNAQAEGGNVQQGGDAENKGSGRRGPRQRRTGTKSSE